MEKVRMSPKGKAKILGTISCLSGTLIFTFWKGYWFKGFVRRPLFLMLGQGIIYNKEEWIKGFALILTSYVAFSGWLILQGTVISYLVYYLQTFCVSERGPMFAAIFSPPLLVIVMIFSAFFLAERLHLGREKAKIRLIVVKKKLEKMSQRKNTFKFLCPLKIVPSPHNVTT